MSESDDSEAAKIEWAEDNGITHVENQMKLALEWLEAKEMIDKHEAALLEKLGSYERMTKYALDQRRVNVLER